MCGKSSGSRVRGTVVPLSVVMGLVGGVAGGLASESQSNELAPLVLDWQDAVWVAPADRPGFPTGIQNAPIVTDPETGGPTYLARFPAGSRFEAHWHTFTETVVVLAGTVDIVLDGQRRTADEGSYIIIPGKVHHEWHVPDDGDVVLLARRDGPADFHFVEP